MSWGEINIIKRVYSNPNSSQFVWNKPKHKA